MKDDRKKDRKERMRMRMRMRTRMRMRMKMRIRMKMERVMIAFGLYLYLSLSPENLPTADPKESATKSMQKLSPSHALESPLLLSRPERLWSLSCLQSSDLFFQLKVCYRYRYCYCYCYSYCYCWRWRKQHYY